MEHKDGLSKYNLFISLHRVQLESSGIPEKFWRTLFKKLENQVMDAGNTFSIFKIEYEPGEKSVEDPEWTVLCTAENGVKCNDVSHIYLIDHAWTYKINKAVINLYEIPGLLDRMCNLMNISLNTSVQEKVQIVSKEMWRFNQTYTRNFGNVESRIPVWYVMDEFGLAIQHSDEPNFRAVPFFYSNDRITYTVLFPIKNVNLNEKITRDYIEGLYYADTIKRKALLIPWKPLSFLDVDFLQNEHDEEYFLAQQLNESLPNEQCLFQHNKSKVFKVYSEYDLICTYLTDPRFQVIDRVSRGEAEILWLTTHFKDYKKLSEETPQKFINQFPYENILTMKHLLSEACRRKQVRGLNYYVDNPPWFPTTYDLNSDLVKFVSYFQHQEKDGINNFWICKPWNLARGLDTTITNNLNCILRLPSSGPKIAQRYICKPLLFHRPNIGLVKFDIRYVILLKSVKPLCLYAYKNFFLRFANKPFSLSEFWDEEKHFTVMNYNEETPLFKMLSNEFICNFNKQNPQFQWSELEKNIFYAIKEIFEAASLKPPPFGLANNVQSRALYAVDLMLSWENDIEGTQTIQPKILEVNWMPDCKRACEYYPTFFNDIFLLLFKDIEDEAKFQTL